MAVPFISLCTMSGVRKLVECLQREPTSRFAFLTLGIARFRLLGPSLWSLFDAALVLASLVVTVVGIRGHLQVVRTTGGIERRLAEASE